MTMREFCEKIGMDEASIQQVEQFSIEDTVYTSYKREFQEDKKRFFCPLKRGRKLACVCTCPLYPHGSGSI